MTKKKIKNNMSSSGLTRGSRNKDLRADWMPDQVGHDRGVESGRSMVEMLGVLAVVGVLSVGSIAGYTYAMNKYYANELLAGASERAVLVAAQIASGRTPNLNEFANHTVPNGTFGDVEAFEDGGFGIKVSKVKDAVCQNILKAVDGTEVFIAKDDNAEVLNEMSESDCSGDDNSFWFVYADDMGAIDSIFDPETPTDEEKKEYICTNASAGDGLYQILFGDNGVSYRFITSITSCPECSFGGMYDSDEAAIAAMCEYGSSAIYRCSGKTIMKNDMPFSDCAVSCTNASSYDSDSEAILAMCESSSSAIYRCSNSAIYKGGDYYGGEFVSSCNGACTNGYVKYASDEAAIAAMCVLLEEYTCDGKTIMREDIPVSDCAVSCTNAGMYDSTDDAIAMMCYSKWLYTCNGKNVMKNGMRVTECAFSCTNAHMYDSDSEAILAMCKS